MSETESDDLRPEDLPPPNADWGDLSEFALTFNGYTYWETDDRCAEIALARRHETLDELRTCLFYEERSTRHSDIEDHASIAYMRELVEMIRAKVEAREES